MIALTLSKTLSNYCYLGFRTGSWLDHAMPHTYLETNF
nr:MAG TPA: hypothetical protein [Caudoviricetes sp.]